MAWVGAEGADSIVAPSRSMATVLERARTVQPIVNSICFDSCLPVFDEMLARSSNLNFGNFPLWVINILAKVSSDIFVLKKR
jgi:hypothetical protein